MRPRHFAHRGSIEVAALLVEDVLREPRARVLALWEPGAIVNRTAVGYFVRFPRPRRFDAERAGGVPFVALREGRLLASAPLSDDELSGLADGVVLVRAGVASPLTVDAEALDPSSWLDVEEWAVARVASLGDPPPPAPRVIPDAEPSRAVFASVVREPPEQHAAIVAALRSDAPSARASTLVHLATFAAALLTRARGLAAVPAAQTGPGVLDQLISRVNDLVARMLVAARLAQFLGKRQAAYVEKLFDMFDRGDLEEALRHAIPLGSEKSSGATRQMLGVPTARRDLAIRLERHHTTSALAVDDGVFGHLRRKYRAALERLEREGRIDEAAFILVELLHEDHEAIAFLERHGRLVLAAEIADARDLAPEIRVRQWFLAGDPARAVAIARAHNAFSAAVARLEGMNRYDPASALRMLWADSLANAGDYAAAVRVIWPLDAAHSIARRWIDLGIELGGVVAAQLVARKIALTPAGSGELLDRVHAILDGDDPEAPRVRRALAAALIGETRTPFGQVVARAAARALYGDLEHDDDGTVGRTIEDLIKFADDAALRADRPARKQSRAEPIPVSREFTRFDAGSVAVTDAALMPDGRTVVALGELGVRVLSRTGRTVAQFDEPAESLVVSDRGDRVIAVARRGLVSRLARIDLLRRVAEPWCEARLDAFARTFDGSVWIAGEARDNDSGTTLVIDALGPVFAALRDLKTTPAVSVARAPERFAVLGSEPFGTGESYAYDATLQLRARAEVTSGGGPGLWAIASDASYGAVLFPLDQLPVATLHAANAPAGVPLGRTGEWPIDLSIGGRFLVAVLKAASHVRVVVIERATLKTVREISFEGATTGGARLQDGAVIAHDDRGRVFALDVASGRTLRDLRV